MITKEEIKNKLKEVVDPEIGVNIVDLGLIYGVKIDGGNVNILMTLTTPGCPLAAMFNQEVARKVKELEGVKKVTVELTFDPPWTPEKMSKEARKKIYG
jgi:metal-sulfur cluster biosynthetic enzyme